MEQIKKINKPAKRAESFLSARRSGLRPVTEREMLQPGEEEELEKYDQKLLAEHRLAQLLKYRQLLKENQEKRLNTRSALDASAGAGTKWIPMGPSAVLKGQAYNYPTTSGRVPGIAVAPGGKRVYAATANGGVWRSEDGGNSWMPLMDAFDVNPSALKADSLACGAIALVPGETSDQDILYVGTGEGHGWWYFGVGPVYSKDGGANWQTEPVSLDSPSLIGAGFYALVVNPDNHEQVIAATTEGIYRREPDGEGNFHWVKKSVPEVEGFENKKATSVVTAKGKDGVFFFASFYNGGIFSSEDGNEWSPLGSGLLPGLQRIALAVNFHEPRVVYAVSGNGNYDTKLFRFDDFDGLWKQIELNKTNKQYDLVQGQGDYDLAIAVDPVNINRIYLGGQRIVVDNDGNISENKNDPNYHHCGALWRCEIKVSHVKESKEIPKKVEIDEITISHFIGHSIHPDIHTIVFSPHDPKQMWVGCDGGIFSTNDPLKNNVVFEPRNNGLQALTMTRIQQNLKDTNSIFCGTHDNGLLHYTGGGVWLYVAKGDCFSCIPNWNDSNKILIQKYNSYLELSTNGGIRFSFNEAPNSGPDKDESDMKAPLVGPPQSSDLEDADIVAFGGTRPWINKSFCNKDWEWRSIPSGDVDSDGLGTDIISMHFATAKILYAGTVNKGIYRYTNNNADEWERAPLHNQPVGNSTDTLENKLPLDTPITSIVSHPQKLESVYITTGGVGDYPHVWYFDGSIWTPKTGENSNQLMDVQHNVIVAHVSNGESAADGNVHLYVGTDIGIWRSTDGGSSWHPYSEGLPDVAVLDIKILKQEASKPALLLASTYGRGVFQRPLGDSEQKKINLYFRGIAGADIKIDVPDQNGNYLIPHDPEVPVDFVAFANLEAKDVIVPSNTPGIRSKVYVQVHNSGTEAANQVQVSLLMAKVTTENLPKLPQDIEASIQKGLPIRSNDWQTIGIKTVNNVQPALPQVVTFDLLSEKLAASTSYCLLALVHHILDQFTIDDNTNPADIVKTGKAVAKSFSTNLSLPVPPHKPDARLKGFVAIPPSATMGGASADAFLGRAFQQNDDVIAKEIQSIILSAPLCNRHLPPPAGGLNSYDWEVINPSTVQLIQAKTIQVSGRIESTAGVPLMWSAQEKIVINGKIDARGKGAMTIAGVEDSGIGDFGGAGGAGKEMKGRPCRLPRLNYEILPGGGTEGSWTGSKGAPLNKDWASRIQAYWPHAKGGAAGGGAGGGDGAVLRKGAGGGIVILCAPVIELTGEGLIDVSGNEGKQDCGGGGGGLVVLIARQLINAMEEGPYANIICKGGNGTGAASAGGDGLVLKMRY